MRARWHPAATLVVDGIGWGAVVGLALPTLVVLVGAVARHDADLLRVGLVLTAAGTMVGAAIGLVVGTCGAAALAVCRRLDRPPGETALTTVAVALLAPVVLAELWGQDTTHAVAAFMVVAAGPLVLDVVRLVRRPTGPRRASRPARPCTGR